MKFELTQEFYFEAAHTLERTIESESSRRIHGHTYHTQVTVGGTPDATTGMIVDLGLIRQCIAKLRDRLDHRFLDEEPELGPVTLENLCRFIWLALSPELAGLVRVVVARRASGDQCSISKDDDR